MGDSPRHLELVEALRHWMTRIAGWRLSDCRTHRQHKAADPSIRTEPLGSALRDHHGAVPRADPGLSLPPSGQTSRLADESMRAVSFLVSYIHVHPRPSACTAGR